MHIQTTYYKLISIYKYFDCTPLNGKSRKLSELRARLCHWHETRWKKIEGNYYETDPETSKCYTISIFPSYNLEEYRQTRHYGVKYVALA